MRGTRAPRKIDVIREQSKVIAEFQTLAINQGVTITALLDRIKILQDRLEDIPSLKKYVIETEMNSSN